MTYIISSGNVSSGIILVSHGDNLIISSGGTAYNTTVNSGGGAVIGSGGTAYHTTVNSRGALGVRYGIANITVVNFSGTFAVSSGGTANSTIISGGSAVISSGGTANDVTVYELGWLSVLDAGTANDATVNSGGRLSVSSGGTANRIRENGGYVGVEEGAIVTFLPNIISGIFFSNASPTIHSGTTATDVTINDFGNLQVVSGGTATLTTVNSRGYLRVYSSGLVNSTTINYRGGLHVESDGTAKNTMVNSGGLLYVYSCGTAYDTMVDSGGTMYVSSGGTANNTIINANCYLYVSGGGSVNNTIINANGYLYVSGGGIVNGTTVNANGSMFVSAVRSGADWWCGLANSTTVNGGKLEVRDGTMNGTTINSTGSMYVYSGGTASSTIVNSTGSMYVRSGGTADNTLLSSGGNLIVYSGGKMTGRMTFGHGAIVSAYDGSILDFSLIGATIGTEALVNDLSIVHGSPKYTLTVDGAEKNGQYTLARGAASFNKTITVVNMFGEALGTLAVGETITVSTTTYALALSGDVLSVSISEDTGAQVTSSSLVLINDSRTVLSGEIFKDTTVSTGGYLLVSSGGTANDTVLNSGGSLYVSSGGTANSIVWTPCYGTIELENGAQVTFASQYSGVYFRYYEFSPGYDNHPLSNTATMDFQIDKGTSSYPLYVMSGGTAYNANAFSNIYVFGGVLNNITYVDTSDYVSVLSTYGNNNIKVFSGGTANDIMLKGVRAIGASSSCHMTVFSGGITNRTILMSQGYLDVISGGVANDTVVSSGGLFYVSSGGTANRTVVNSLSYERVKNGFEISSGGIANDTLINPGGYMFVSSGGTANNTTVIGGSMFISSGGTANSVKENGGYVIIEEGASATFVSNVFSGLTFENTWVTAHSGTTATDTTVNYGGWFLVSSGGIANATTVNSQGYIFVFNGGTAFSPTVSSGGVMKVSSGGMLTGRTTLKSGADVSAYEGAILNFDLTQTSAGEEALVNDLSIVKGTPKYTLTVAGNETNGAYVLAEIAASFSNTITVQNTSGEAIGTISVNGETVFVGSTSYKLNLIGDTLSVSVVSKDASDTTKPTVSNVVASTQAPTNQNVIVTADFSDDVELVQSLYRIGEGGTWTAYPTGGVTVSDNATVFFKAVDAAGNESDPVSITISNIDKVKPTISGITPNTTDPAASVTVTAVFADDVGLASKHYKIGDGTWKDYTGGVTVTTNTTVYFKAVDTAGNETTDSYVVRNIETAIQDTTKPVVSNVQANITAPTNQNVTVTADFSDDVGIASRLFKIDKHAWQDYIDGVTVSENSTIYFKAVDTSGNESEVAKYEVKNIDKIKPEKPTASADITDTTDGEVKVSAVFSDDSIVREFSRDNQTWSAYTGAVAFTENGVAYFRGTDAAGNISEVASYTVSNITGGADITSSGLILYSRQTAVVQANEIYEDTTVSSGGSMLITPGGIANDITLNYGGYLSISSGGVAKRIIANSGCKAFVSAGGTATEITENGGYVEVTNGATVSFLPNSFSDVSALIYISIHSGTIANNTNLTGSMFVYSGGIANTTTNGGTMSVSSGAVVNNTICNNRGQLNLYGGTANNTTVNANGMVNINPGGMADSITVSSGGWLSVYNGKVTGKMTFEDGSHISAMENTIFDFDISELESSSSALVNNLSLVQGTPNYTLTVSDTQAVGTYKLAESAGDFDTSISVVNTAGESLGSFMVGGTVKVGDADCTLKLTDSVLSVTVAVSGNTSPLDNLVGTPDKVSWNAATTGEEQQFVVEYSTDNFEHVIQVVTTASATDLLDLPAGTYQWRVKAENSEEWAVGEAFVSESESDTPKVVQSNEDGNDDLFFASTNGTWENIYYAHHVGSIGDWGGTNDWVSAAGKGRIQNLFFGSSDPNVLCLTDADNGDAIFVDDVYTDSPDDMAKETSRLYKIQEIRAGAGSDIVDMTSQRFEYTGDGLMIRGGDGDDTIWANKGDNMLFGDAGNDRIVGASGNDVIVGGIGNDRMHGGGGNDIFTFCDNWGTDTIEQLATGKVTLWFAESESQITASELDGNSVFTNADGTASVTVKGFALADIAVMCGDDGTEEYKALVAAGAFAEFTSQKIFEESGKGMLA